MNKGLSQHVVWNTTGTTVKYSNRSSASRRDRSSYKIRNVQCFSTKILLEGQSGPRRLVLGANSLGQGPIDNNWAISNTVSHLEVFRCERINTAKQKDGLTYFLMLSVLEAKIFKYGFLEEYKACVNSCY